MTGRIITAEVQGAAARALEVVNELGGEVEGRAIYIVALKEALEPLRRLTLGAACGRCRRDVAWWALDATEAFVVAFQRRCPPRERIGGIYDCYGTNPWPPEGRKSWPWIELAESGKTTVTLEDIHTAGYPLRLRFTCRKCHAEYVTKNTSRLKLFLDAVAHREDKLWLK